jgi:Tfp pilus assembly protein PilF
LIAEIGMGPTTPQSALDAVAAERLVLEEYRPIAEALDWTIGQVYFSRYGQSAFVRGDVPFAVHNDGHLSKLAADLLFTTLSAADAEGTLEREIAVLELGVGSGLFARFFLDRFRQCCDEGGKDYYDRCRYICADKHQRMLDDLRTRGVLEAHPDRFRLVNVDAMEVAADLAAGVEHDHPRFRAVFLNYLLDCLPFSVLETRGPAVRELVARTYLARNAKLGDHFGLSVDDVKSRIASRDGARLEDLVDLYPMLGIELLFRDVSGTGPLTSAGDQADADGALLLDSHGAVRCLSQLVDLLANGGFVLISDYGSTDQARPSLDEPYQHFAASTAVGINFGQIKTVFDRMPGVHWVEPESDVDSNRVRLLGRKLAPVTQEAFRRIFHQSVFDSRTARLNSARTLAKGRRLEGALAAYRRVLADEPWNWMALNETAECLLYSFQQPQAALDLARASAAINPLYPDVWNIHGDCLFALGRYEEAESAFEQALCVHPEDVRARYNLVQCYSRRRDFAGSFRTIAEGLALDRRGHYRERLLQRQSELLSEMSRIQEQRHRLLADKFSLGLNGGASVERCAAT